MPDLTPEQEQGYAYRAGKILEMRRNRIPMEECAAEFGISVSYAHRIYKKALAEYPTQHAEEYRAEELQLVDEAVHSLLAIARGHHEVRTKWLKSGPVEYDYYPTYKDRIEAWNAIQKWSETKRKLTGIDAPTQIQFTTESIQAEVARLLKLIEEEEQQAIEAGSGA